MTASLSQADARAWIDRWDAQQQSFLPDREERFTALIDAVQECAGRPDPLVLDLGCGPGSLATRLLRQIPAATVIAIDADPLLLALGRAAWNGQAGQGRGAAGPGSPGPAGSLRFADLDLRVPGWTAALGLDRKADAAVSTTALHWLPPDALAAMYAEVATVLRAGGLILNGDHMTEDKSAAPTLARLGRALNEREERRRAPAGETWEGWWDAVTADPALATEAAERARRTHGGEHHGSPSGRLSVHVEALRAAGCAEVGTIWQRGDNRLLCGVLGSPGPV
jgi:SAM-dependent methyltransferase